MLIKENRRFSPLSAVLLMLLLAAWACSYITLPMYLNICDETYQIMCGWDYRSSVAAPLSAWFTSAIGPLWNFDNLPFRIMGWTLQVISVIIGMLPAWWMSRNINFTLGAGALSIFLFSLCRCLEATFSWDSYAVPALMVVTVLCFSYYIKPKWWKIAAMGTCCGILLTLRLPSGAAILLPVVAIIFVNGLSKKSIGRLCALLAIYVFTVFIILTLLYGSISQFLGYIATNLISAHEPHTLREIYIISMNMLCVYAFGAAGLFFIINKTIKANTSVIRTLIITVFVSICFFILIYSLANYFFWYFSYLFSPLYIITEIYLIRKTSGKLRFGVIIALIASLLGGFGSNIIVARLVVFPTMTFVLYFLARAASTKAKIAVFFVLWLPMIATNHVFVTDLFYNYKQNHVLLTHEKPVVPHMHGMWVTPSHVEMIQSIAARFMPFVNDTAYNTGVMRNTPNDFIYEYIFDSRCPFYSHCWDWEPLMLDKDYTDRFTHWIESSERPVAVLMVRHQYSLDGPEEEIIGEYKRRYRTVYSDSLFTIVIKDAD